MSPGDHGSGAQHGSESATYSGALLEIQGKCGFWLVFRAARLKVKVVAGCSFFSEIQGVFSTESLGIQVSGG